MFPQESAPARQTDDADVEVSSVQCLEDRAVGLGGMEEVAAIGAFQLE